MKVDRLSPSCVLQGCGCHGKNLVFILRAVGKSIKGFK